MSSYSNNEVSAGVTDSLYVKPTRLHWRIIGWCVGVSVVICLVVIYLTSNHKYKSISHNVAVVSNTDVSRQLAKSIVYLNHLGHKRHLQNANASTEIIKPNMRAHPVVLSSALVKRMQAHSSVFSPTVKDMKVARTKQHGVQVVRQDPRYVLYAGELMHATLETAIQSDIPGPVRAVLSQPVYAYRGHSILIPVGTRLLGSYRAVMASAQTRIGVIWQRAILPSGDSVDLSAPTMGPVGRMGVEADKINRHFWLRIREAAVLSLLSGGVALSAGVNADTQTAGQVFREKLANGLSDAAADSFLHQGSLRPTLFINPGAQIQIFINKDINFANILFRR